MRRLSHKTGRRGTILIVTMWIVLVLAGMVLVLARSMRIEAICSANDVAARQAEAIQQGAIQYVLAHLSTTYQTKGSVPTLSDMPCEAVQVGQGAFWIIRQNVGNTDQRQYTYGLADEASKLNLNRLGQFNRRNLQTPTAVIQKLEDYTSEMTNEVAACIYDWIDADNSVTAGGAENDYYQSLGDPYQCKNAQLDTLEELLLVKNIDGTVLYGEDVNRNGVLDDNENDGDLSDPPDNRDGKLDMGIAPYVTVYSMETSSNTTIRGKINVNTAPAAVLHCLTGLPLVGLTDSDVSTLVSNRMSASTIRTDTDWVRTALPQKYQALAPFITGKSYQFSADIVSISGDGRAFKRCRIVVDNRGSQPKVIYFQDLTRLGWPLSQDILDRLRNGGSVADLPRQSVQETY